MRRSKRNHSSKNAVLIGIGAILTVLILTSAIIFVINHSATGETKILAVNANEKRLALEEIVLSEVAEEVILVSQDDIKQEETHEEEEVKSGDLVVKVPKSKVATVNSAEDSDKKKTGGSAVSQAQAANMFESVGTKSFGIDVSQHQGVIDWQAVRNSGVDFAIIRCGFRGNSSGGIYEDTYFKRNVAGASAAGIKVGIYFYSCAINENEALEEAAWVVRKISTYGITYPVVYDFEDFGKYRCSGVDGAQATNNALTFLNFVRQNGYEPMMYANKSDIQSRMSRSSFSGIKFWLAHYTTQTDYSGSYQMWQYTSKGSVPGISGNVDMDIAYFSYGTSAVAKHLHDFSELVKNSEKAATCTVNGSKVFRCACGETETQTTQATGHVYGDWKVTKEATNLDTGTKERKCTVCNDVEVKTIPILTSNNIANAVDNTTNTNTNTNTAATNSTGTNSNSSANNNTVGENTPPAHTHSYTFVTDKAATCTEEGSKHEECSCGDKKAAVAIPKADHKYVDGKCSVCQTPDQNYQAPAPEPKNETTDENTTV